MTQFCTMGKSFKLLIWTILFGIPLVGGYDLKLLSVEKGPHNSMVAKMRMDLNSTEMIRMLADKLDAKAEPGLPFKRVDRIGGVRNIRAIDFPTDYKMIWDEPISCESKKACIVRLQPPIEQEAFFVEGFELGEPAKFFEALSRHYDLSDLKIANSLRPPIQEVTVEGKSKCRVELHPKLKVILGQLEDSVEEFKRIMLVVPARNPNKLDELDADWKLRCRKDGQPIVHEREEL